MLVFPNAKINIGLNIISKRQDGYHNIETVFYPLFHLYDALEAVEAKSVSLTVSGFEIDCRDEDNLIIKAYRLLQKDFGLPPLAFYLKKAIPFGAGLGGGSSDATFTLKAIDEKYNLNLSSEKLIAYAQRIGSDCSFFVANRPSFATSKGEELYQIDLNLKGKYLLLVKPDIHINTKEAYENIVPQKPSFVLTDAIKRPVEEWRGFISNDFERNIFEKYPVLEEIKNKLYSYGALYSAMSGSGSAIYGIFDENPKHASFDNKLYNKIVAL